VGTSGASRALVISDGIPLADPFGGWFTGTHPMTSVSAVEVVEGGVSDLYGGEALGGVINVIPRRPKILPYRSKLSTETRRRRMRLLLPASAMVRGGHCFRRRVPHQWLRVRIATSAGKRGRAGSLRAFCGTVLLGAAPLRAGSRVRQRFDFEDARKMARPCKTMTLACARSPSAPIGNHPPPAL